MVKDCLFMGWNRPVIGREKMAVELFSMVINYLGKQQKDGTIDSFEPVLLAVHGGDMNGYILVRGDATKLDKMRHADEFLELITRCNYNVDGFGVIPGWLGDKLTEQMGRFGKLVSEG